ncbi:unnamed protein product [Leptidea sinapis]|uniref:EF-hand domain-containing protein n=1 Tax=Leptidea sinapis TaxID=189913 RepID=A0A5E4Q6P2_9NEOP|nr:unnamed protein product [Leptidea sinapis]
MARKEEPKIQPNNELEKKIIEAFEVFDHSGKQVVDVREVGTILRSLEASGNVPLQNFLPYMCKVMTEHRLCPATAEVLLAAFRYFDKEGRGYITKERFATLMLEEGEPFTEEEFDEMMQTALDPVTDTITYEYYINQLLVAPMDVYKTADAVEEERKKREAAAPRRRRASSLLRAARN